MVRTIQTHIYAQGFFILKFFTCIKYHARRTHATRRLTVGDKCSVKNRASLSILWVEILQATHSNCGKLLRASDTKLMSKDFSGEGNDHLYGKNSEDWTIRSQAPKRNSTEKVQRLSGCGLLFKSRSDLYTNNGLRYSPAPVKAGTEKRV
jgi:hypothetical protein